MTALASPAALAMKLSEVRPWSSGTGKSDPSDAFQRLIELVNDTRHPQSLKGWYLAGADGYELLALPSWRVPAGGRLTIVLGHGRNDSNFGDGLGTWHAGEVHWLLDPSIGEVGLYRGRPSLGTLMDFRGHGVTWVPGARECVVLGSAIAAI